MFRRVTRHENIIVLISSRPRHFKLVSGLRDEYVQVMSNEIPNRCRLVLIVTAEQLLGMGQDLWPSLATLFEQGDGTDVASIIFSQDKSDETEFAAALRPAVDAMQSADIAVMVHGDERIAARLGADGIQFPPNRDTIVDAIERYAPKMMVGIGNVRSRHTALELGELQPDYVLFGKSGGDSHDDPHPKNLGLGEWWSAMVEIPCIVLAGRKIESVADVAKNGCDFAALSFAIFNGDGKDIDDMASHVVKQIRAANQILVEQAPEFEDPED